MSFEKRWIDWLALICIFVFVAGYSAWRVDFSQKPFEDAAILMRYADHFAQGYGVVWNIGDPPVDGATDFLFMVFLGELVRMGMGLEFATRAIGFGAHLLTIWLIYLALRRLSRAGWIPALFSALYLAVGPGIYYVAAYFGTPFFALFACLTWCLALALMRKPESWGLAVAFAFSGLTTGLIRPEGVILASLMLLAIVVYCGVKQSSKVILVFGLVFAVLGGSYFLWRWNYFGYPLPNPFYKKGGGALYIGSLKGSLLNTFYLTWLFIPFYLCGLRSSRLLRLTISYAIPLIGFTVAFVLLSNEMNHMARFQYCVLPIVLVSWYDLVKDLRADLKLPAWSAWGWKKRVSAISFAVVVTAGVFWYQTTRGLTYPVDGRYDMAWMLREYREKGYVLATSEAGLLPLYSQWRTIDTWGLNDPWIAHHGGITGEYLGRFQPHLIVFHAYFPPLQAPSDAPEDRWLQMTLRLREYAEQNGYTLAAVYGNSPGDTHYYYVYPDFEDHLELVERIRGLKYWYSQGVAVNYAVGDGK